MNKSVLIKETAKETGLSQKDCLNALNAITQIIAKTLRCGDNVTLLGFGKFEVRHRAVRKGVNPRTQQPIVLPASKIPVFRVSKTFKQAIY